MADADRTDSPHTEYAGERDMDAFWKATEISREPFKQRWYIPAVLVLIVLSVPWYFAEGHTGRILGGLPVWVWITLSCSFLVSCLIGVAVLRFWRDDAPDRE